MCVCVCLVYTYVCVCGEKGVPSQLAVNVPVSLTACLHGHWGGPSSECVRLVRGGHLIKGSWREQPHNPAFSLSNSISWTSVFVSDDV